jgi:hypothetical protein
MTNKISMATLTVSVSSRQVAAWQTPVGSVKRALTAGLQGAAAVSTYTAMVIATLAPTVLPMVLIGYGVMRYLRRRREAR